jgi:bifunctional DNase/RNase
MQADENGRPSVGLWLYVLRRIRGRLLLAVLEHRWNFLLGVVVAVALLAYLVVRGVMDTPSAGVGVSPIAVSVQHLEPQGNSLPLILVERDGARQLVIRELGSTEARVIARQQGIALEGEQPLAYDLMRDLLEQTGGHVDQVIIVDGDRGQFVGRIVVSSGGETRMIRAKTADAVALALKTGAPIFVEGAVLDRAGVVRDR